MSKLNGLASPSKKENKVADLLNLIGAVRSGFDPRGTPKRRSAFGFGVIADPTDAPGSWSPVAQNGQAIPITYLDGVAGGILCRVAARMAKKIWKAHWENAHWACYNHARFLGNNPEAIPLYSAAPEYTREKGKEFLALAEEFIPAE